MRLIPGKLAHGLNPLSSNGGDSVINDTDDETALLSLMLPTP